ncbi:MAG TPA: hypothetical protein VEC12_08575, partial [Bacteroidia bacterium]|nr:hypothetical protein [Bacteroidia bacterium]
MDNLLSHFASAVAKINTAGEALEMSSFSDMEAADMDGMSLPRGPAKRTPAPVPNIVLQLAALPTHIDLKQFTNPFAPDNPQGDYIETFRFRSFADPIPELSSLFQPTQYSSEGQWGNVLYSAHGINPYATHVLEAAQSKYENYKLSNFGGVSDDWRPVYAKPGNWYQMARDKANYTPVTLDFEKDANTDNSFVIINNNKSGLKWRSIADDGVVDETEVKGTLRSIDMKIMKVDFDRPWLVFDILKTPGIKMNGLNPGYFSTGTFEDNMGIFPLIITSILIGTDISVKGSWKEEDKNFINDTRGGNLSIGPFTV